MKAKQITLGECQSWLMARGVCEAGFKAEVCSAPFQCDQYCARFRQRPLNLEEQAVLAERDRLQNLEEARK